MKMNNLISIDELINDINKAYQLLANNEIELFLDAFSVINTNYDKTNVDIKLVLKLTDDVNRLLALVEEKNVDLSKNIRNTRTQLKAHHSYKSF